MAKYVWQEIGAFGTPELLEAAGSIIAAFNLCEISLWSLLDEVMFPPRGMGHKLYGVMKGNQERIDALLIITEQIGDKAFTAKVQAFAKHFNICAENRNIIAHGIYQPDWAAFGERHLIAKGRSKGEAFKEMNTFPADKDQMLKIANDCWETQHFGMALMAYLLTLPGRTLEGMPPIQPTLPETPAQPDKLNPLPPQDPQAYSAPP